MQQADRKPFYQSWAAAWEQCGKSVTETSLRFAFECLQQYDLADIQRGILQHATNPDCGQFAPKSADIIRQIEGSPDERAARAWAKVAGAIESHGPYARIAFDDPAIHAALDGGTWASLCSVQSYHDLSFRQKEFQAAYKAALGSNNYPAVLCAIPSSAERAVDLIGDTGKAQRVLENGSAKQIGGLVGVGKLLEGVT